MLHLKDMIKDKNNLDHVNLLDNVLEIVKLIGSRKSFAKELINDKDIFSDGAVSDRYFLKMLENCDFNEYIIESNDFAGTFIKSEDLKIDENSDYLFLYNDEINILIPVVNVKNQNENYYKIYIDELISVKEYMIEKCDGCSCSSLKELLFNLYPEINIGLNSKYSNFKGMVCSDCLERMENGLTLKNEEEINENTEEGNSEEKIDEFSSIEDILKFCGMDNREELEKALKDKIYKE